MALLSVCIIAKNEEEHLSACLDALKPYDVEIVIVDTGSTDRTKEIAARYTDKIYDFAWCDDFSAARNFSIEKAETDRILVLDCDEVITSFDVNFVSDYLSKNPATAGRVLSNNPYIQSGIRTVKSERITRVFDRRYYAYKGRIHEQVVARKEAFPKHIGYRGKSSASLEPSAADLPIVMDHCGYDVGNPVNMKEKAERNIRLLLMDLKDDPDAYVYYQLGQSYYSIGNYEEALRYFKEGLNFDLDERLDWVQAMVEAYGYTLLALKKYEEALQLESLEEAFGVTSDFHFVLGLIYMNVADFEFAIDEFLKATKAPKCHVQGSDSFLAYYNIGVIFECLGQKSEALKYYELCGDFEPALSRKEFLAQ